MVTVTVTGTNDIPLITSSTDDATGDVLEAGVMNGGNTPEPGVLSTGGTLTASDVDNGASWSWSFVPTVNVYGSFSINASTGEWSYTLADNALVDALAQGETHDETFLVTVTDEHGAFSTQVVTVTVTGTNDIPVLTITDAEGILNEDENDPTLTDTGALSFTDVDVETIPAYIGHDISAAYQADSLVWSGGDITSVLSASEIQTLIDGFSVYQDHWDYSVLNSLIQFLAEDETITLSFDITVIDKHGAYTTDTVNITINGTNDGIEGEFAKEIWVPTSLAEISIPYLDGYPLNITIPTDADINDEISVTNMALAFVDPGETANLGTIWYIDDDTNILTQFNFNSPVDLSATELGSLIYKPDDNSSIDEQIDISLTFTINSGNDSVDGNFIIHSVPANSLGGNSVLIGDGSSPLTSGNDQDAYLSVSSAFADALNTDPANGALDLFTDFQHSPFAIPIPVSEQGGATGQEREDEVSVRITINGISFIALAAANGVIDWAYDPGTGLMKAHILYSNIVMESNPAVSLVDYLDSNPAVAGNIWTITYLDNDGGPYQARFVQATFTHELLPDDAITVSGTMDVDNLIFGTTQGDSLTGANLNDEIYGREGNDFISGLEGDDQLLGGSGNDTIYGGLGNDLLIGGIGDDSLLAGAGSDTLYGNEGNDLLDVGTDSDVDTVIWDLASGDGGTDTVINFNITDDRLDLSDLLVGEETGNLSDYLSVSFDGSDTIILVDADGLANGTSFDDLTIVLQGVNIDLAGLENATNLLGQDTLIVTVP